MDDQLFLVSPSKEQFPFPTGQGSSAFISGTFSAFAECSVRCRGGECHLSCAWTMLFLQACPIFHVA